jgi:hypothetical protein
VRSGERRESVKSSTIQSLNSNSSILSAVLGVGVVLF